MSNFTFMFSPGAKVNFSSEIIAVACDDLRPATPPTFVVIVLDRPSFYTIPTVWPKR